MPEVTNWDAIDEGWFRHATEDQLREFVSALDNNEITDEKKRASLAKAFNRECDRRSGAFNDSLNKGEWI